MRRLSWGDSFIDDVALCALVDYVDKAEIEDCPMRCWQWCRWKRRCWSDGEMAIAFFGDSEGGIVVISRILAIVYATVYENSLFRNSGRCPELWIPIPLVQNLKFPFIITIGLHREFTTSQLSFIPFFTSACWLVICSETTSFFDRPDLLPNSSYSLDYCNSGLVKIEDIG